MKYFISIYILISLYFSIVDANIASISQLTSSVINAEQNSIEKKYCTFLTSELISNTNKIDRIISIIENSIDSNENTYITVSNMEESMRAGRLHSLALVYVSADEILLQPQSILANTAAYVTTSKEDNDTGNKKIDSKDTKTLMIVLDVTGKSLSKAEAAKQMMTKSFSPEAIGIGQDSEIDIEIHIIDHAEHDTIQNVIQAVNGKMSNVKAWSGKQVQSLIGSEKHIIPSISKTSTKKNTLHEARLTQTCSPVVDTFLGQLNGDAVGAGGGTQALTSGKFPGFEASLEEMKAIVEEALIDLTETAHIEELEKIDNVGSSAYKLAVERGQLGLAATLKAFHRSCMNRGLSATKDAFDQKLRRVGAGRNFAKALKELAKKHVSEFVTSCNDFEMGLCKCYTEALTSPLLSHKNIKKVNLKSQLGSIKLEIDALNTYCIKALKGRMDSLFLQGTYNPFIRLAKYPPLHVNLNYLVDPRGIGFNIDHSRYYDAHFDGIAADRADLLHAPNSATIPFNPHSLASQMGEPTWWERLRDYYDAVVNEEV